MLNKFCLISVRGHYGGIICASSRRQYSHDMKVICKPQTAHLKRGSGGRSSFNGNVVTVFGANGFVGRHVCNQLGKIGCQLIIPYRCDSDEPTLKALKLAGDLGQVLFQPFDLRDPISIRKAIKYSNIVINLIGRDFETKNFSFFDVHQRGAREIAAACRELNVERFIHVSSLNLTDKPKRFYLKKLNFLPSKLLGEQAVREEYPNATVFRPGTLYGLYDTFLWPLCATIRSTANSIGLYAKGEKTIKQPLFISDFAKGVVQAMNDNDTRGKIYQAVGPERFLLKDLATFCMQVLQRHRRTDKLIHDIWFDVQYPVKVFFCRYILELFYSAPQRNVAFEYIEKESVTDVVDPSLPTMEDFGFPLTRFEDKVPGLINPYFKTFPGADREFKQDYPAEGLTGKAIRGYDPSTLH